MKPDNQFVSRKTSNNELRLRFFYGDIVGTNHLVEIKIVFKNRNLKLLTALLRKSDSDCVFESEFRYFLIEKWKLVTSNALDRL